VSDQAGKSTQQGDQPYTVKRNQVRLLAKKPALRGINIGGKVKKPKVFLKPNQRAYYFQQTRAITPPKVLKSASDKLLAAKWAARALIASEGWNIWKGNGAYRVFANALKEAGVKKILLKRYRVERSIMSSPKDRAIADPVPLIPEAASEFPEPEMRGTNGNGEDQGAHTPKTGSTVSGYNTPAGGKMRRKLAFSSVKSPSLGARIRAIFRGEVTPRRHKRSPPVSPMETALRELRVEVDKSVRREKNFRAIMAGNTPPHPSPILNVSTSATPPTPAAGHKSPGPNGRWVRHRRSPLTSPVEKEASIISLSPMPQPTPETITLSGDNTPTDPPTSPLSVADLLDSEEEELAGPEWSPISSYGRSLESPDYRPITPEEDEVTDHARHEIKKTADVAIQTARKEENTTVLSDLVIARRYLMNAIEGLNNIHNQEVKRMLQENLVRLQEAMTETRRGMEPEIITLDD
jgi:hypothetical protein